MSRQLHSASNYDLYERIGAKGEYRKRYIVELQNLYTDSGHHNFSLDNDIEDVDMAILTPYFPEELTLQVIARAAESGTTVVLLSPHRSHSRERLCERIIGDHYSTTLHRAEYILILNNHLPKQHFQL